MNNSTLPPLLGNYLTSYEEKAPNSLPRSEEVVVTEEEENVNSSSNEVEKKSKSSRAVLAQKRMMEAEEKASKEREEKALHTLKMWNAVKENERKRKQKLLRDRVNLQHKMIKKQDQLHEILEKQQRQDKDLQQNAHPKHQKAQLAALGTSRSARRKPQKTKPRKTKNKTQTRKLSKAMEELSIVKTILEVCDEEKHSETSQKDAFSEEDLSEFMENFTMEDADFGVLRHQPLNVQLQELFGDKAAAIYLNPTVEESPRKALDPGLGKKKGGYGATALWETLRDFSRQKLRNKDALILPDVKNAYACFARECLRRHVTPVKRNFVSEEETPVNVNVEESDLLKDVRYRRHRQELMFRIAHVNKEKTKLVFQALGPHYVDSKTQEGLRRYYPHIPEKEDEGFPSITVEGQNRPRSAHVSNNVLLSKQPKPVKPTEDLEKQTRGFGDKLVFLTEEKASCKGQFAKRLVKQGENEEVNTDLRKSKSLGSCVFEHNAAKKPEILQRLWEPLSMDALLEHKESFFKRRTDLLVQGPFRTCEVPTR